ncbi:MAG: hypothetical protein EBR82_31240 [Caulobacteraceae bacterium]|nr:hypothetical protein [Caulobacteraceae bacterium]
MTVDRFRLGRDCVLEVDGLVLSGVRNVTPKRTAKKIEATGWGDQSESVIVTHRTWELEIEVVRADDADVLRSAEDRDGLVTVRTFNGLREISGDFTVLETTAPEGLDDAVVATFSLRQWAHGR